MPVGSVYRSSFFGGSDKDQNLLKPYNFAEGSPGLGFNIYELGNKEKIAVINIMGNLFMRSCDNAFFKIEEVLQKIDANDLSFIFVDFHAEATSEKVAMGHHLDGRVTAVVGTHQHVPTADSHILPKGTAYQTDAGMCGDYNSIIGMSKEPILDRFQGIKSKSKFSPAMGEATICGVIIESDTETGLAKNIKPIKETKGSASKAVASTKSEKQEKEVIAEGHEMRDRFKKLAGIL